MMQQQRPWARALSWRGELKKFVSQGFCSRCGSARVLQSPVLEVESAARGRYNMPGHAHTVGTPHAHHHASVQKLCTCTLHHISPSALALSRTAAWEGALRTRTARAKPQPVYFE